MIGVPRIGVVVPPGTLLDHEYSRLAGPERRVYVSRTDSVEGGMVHRRALTLGSAELVQPAVVRLADVEPQAVVFACASGSFAGGTAGERKLVASMLAAGAEAATTTSGALRRLLKTRQARAVAVVTPYTDTLTRLLVSFLGESGIEVPAVYCHGMVDPVQVATVGAEMLSEMVQSVDDAEAEAVFVSCTNLPTLGHLERLSAMAGKPVLSANLVTIWGALEVGGDQAGAAALVDPLWEA